MLSAPSQRNGSADNSRNSREGPAANDGNPATATKRYVAQVTLPTSMPVGSYSVQVSRDGVSWVGVASQQTLSVLPNPAAPATFPVSSYGGCVANDGVDDTPCIVNAIAAARVAGGGSVTFGAGVWNVGNSSAAGVTASGILVPVGVNLSGVGASSTIVQRDVTWNAQTPTFTLQRNNTIQGINFKDARIYQPSSASGTMIQLGRGYVPGDPGSVSGVAIVQNVFDKPFVAIQDSGLPVDHLLVANNEFGAYQNAIYFDTASLSDAAVLSNTFKPGSLFNTSPVQATVATQLSSGVRLDFSGNTADGAATQYLYNATADQKGWGAAFFWSMRGPDEQMLISQNTATCTGDKGANGEAIAFDNNHNDAGLPSKQAATAASSNTVTVPGPLQVQSAGYYNGYWVTVAQGPGQGQVRKIVSYSSPTPTSPVTFTVSPAWDVMPQSSSMITVAREFWQVYTLDNFVDHRQPLCQKSNPGQPSGGVIALYAQTADSVVEGNQQYDTNGIGLVANYTVQDPQYGTQPSTFFQSFVDVRGNTVNGEYSWPSDCSFSGIGVGYAASPTTGFPPPVEAYGVSIAHNTITQADGFHDGAISFTRGWFPGPSPSSWDAVESTLVFRNVINNITLPAPSHLAQWPSCNTNQFSRIGAHTEDSLVWHTVLYANSCNNVAKNLSDGGTATQRVCPASAAANSCECSPYVQGNSATAQSAQSSVRVAYPSAQTAGNLNLVVVGWADSSQQVSAVTDSAGNSYSLAISKLLNGGSQSIYYARNISSASSNTVTVTFTGAASSPDLRIAEYAGLDPTNPLDVASSLWGSGSTANTGWVTTTNANDLLVAANYDATLTTGPGTGYALRILTSPNGNILEDETVTRTAAYSATAPLAKSGQWLAQLVAFRLAGGGDAPSAQALTAPSSLSATAVSGTRINLSWSASTDNIGVAGYSIERCAGVNCSNFAPIGTIAGTTYSDTGIIPSNTYSYRVRAMDTANLQSAYSAVVVVTKGP